jgi:RHH-type rel operon transcriptional repressor/antitoxin RelB
MPAITIEVDEETQHRVQKASLTAGVSLATFTRDALLSRLEDLEDEREAAEVLLRLKQGEEGTITLEELERRIGLDG